MENRNNANEKEGQEVSRRGFLDYLLGGALAVSALAVLGAVGAFLWPTRTTATGELGKVEVSSESDLPVGKGKVVPIKGTSAIVIHTRAGFVAFSAVCTHEYCLVKWDEARQQIVCPCHGAIFDSSGNVLSGPAPRPLPVFPVEVLNGRIYLKGV